MAYEVDMNAEDLIPPDFERCQAYPNVAKWTPFSLGPRPDPIQCESKPVWLAVEAVAGKDGLAEMRERIQLQPIFCAKALEYRGEMS